MSRLKLILSAGICSIALSGCVPVAASLALSAVSLVTGGGGGNNGNTFRNPVDRQSTSRQVKEAISRLDDRVDPACQTMLDEIQKAKAGAVEKPAAGVVRPPSTEDRRATTRAPAAAQPKEAPINLLAKLGPGTSEEVQDVARSAETASGGAELQPAAADPASNPVSGRDEAKPIKTALASAPAAAPGQCEHRLVCLPGTPKPTLMLMCPGKGGGKDGGGKDGKATMASNAPAEPQDEAASPAAADAGQPERQETAASVTAAAPAVSPATAAEATMPAPVLAPSSASAETPVLERGVADWNWAYDPAKQL